MGAKWETETENEAIKEEGNEKKEVAGIGSLKHS